MATADDLLNWARSQIGTTENPPDSNIVHYWVDCGMPQYQGQPWCAAFVLAGLLRVGVGPVTRSVYVPRIVQDYKGVGRLYPAPQARPGDQVLYNWAQGHTGIVESVDPIGQTVTAIEGNTSSGAAGSQDNGGGVYRRVRSWTLVTGVGRPPFDPPRPPPAPPANSITTGETTEDGMTPHNVHVAKLDAQGNGYVDLTGVPAPTVVSIVGNGQDPAGRGYGNCAVYDREDVGGSTRVNIHGGVPNGGVDFTVWTTP